MTAKSFLNQLSLPLICSPMFLVSGTELVIESCKNGICGTLPALNGRAPKDFESMLKTITKELILYKKTKGQDAAPFGVNLIVNKTNPRIKEDLNLCIKYKVPLVITSLGAVKDVVDRVHDYGGLVFHDVIKKRHAEKAAEAGVDGIIAICAGAGGHGGTASPFALLKEIKEFFNGLLILAGGMSTGSDILAAQIMGADLAYIGTRFIATRESLAQPTYKKRLTQISLEDIVYTAKITGVNANFIKDTLPKIGANHSLEPTVGISALNDKNHKAWKDIWSAGHGVVSIQDIPKVKELISRLKSDYNFAVNKQYHLLKNTP